MKDNFVWEYLLVCFSILVVWYIYEFYPIITTIFFYILCIVGSIVGFIVIIAIVVEIYDEIVERKKKKEEFNFYVKENYSHLSKKEISKRKKAILLEFEEINIKKRAKEELERERAYYNWLFFKPSKVDRAEIDLALKLMREEAANREIKAKEEAAIRLKKEKEAQELLEKQRRVEIEQKARINNSKDNRTVNEIHRIKDYSKKNMNTQLLHYGESTSYGYYYAFLMHYYPKNKYDKHKLKKVDLENRQEIYNFKEGVQAKKHAQIFSEILLTKYDEEELEEKTLVIIPAATEERTRQRFFDFCEYMSYYTGIENGYSYIINKRDRESSYLNKRRDINLKNYITVDKSKIKGKDFIVIDDVRTRGTSSDIVYDLLMRSGAEDVTFFYMAKTHK